MRLQSYFFNLFYFITALLTISLLVNPPQIFASEEWSAPRDISNSTLSILTPAIAAGNNGKVYVTWYKVDPETALTSVYLANKVGGSWATPSVVNPGTIGPHSIVIDRSGTLHLLYHGLESPFLTYYRTYDGDSWTSPISISDEKGRSQQWPSIIVDSSNIPHIVWPHTPTGNNAQVYYSNWDGSDWTEPQVLSPSNTFSYLPRIAIDSNGGIHIVWLDYNSRKVYYKKLGSEFATLLTNPTIPAGDPDIAVDKNGIVHVVWIYATGNYDVYHTYLDTSLTEPAWSVPENVSNTDERALDPSIAADSENNVHLVWQGRVGGNSEILYKKREGGDWNTEFLNISNNPSTSWHPNITSDSNGGLHVVWLNNTDEGPNHVFYSTLAPEGKKLSVDLIRSAWEPWNGNVYDHADKGSPSCGITIAQCGCALTSLAMILRYYDVTVGPSGEDTNPETLNEYFNRAVNNPIRTCKKTLLSGEEITYQGRESIGYWCGRVIWPTVGKYSQEAAEYRKKVKGENKPPMIKYVDRIYEHKPEKYREEIDKGNPVIVQVIHPDPHWLVATGYVDDTFWINDPGFERNRLDHQQLQNQTLAYVLYEKITEEESANISEVNIDSETTSGNFSGLLIVTSNPDQLLITDSEGRRAGFDPETSEILEEVPGSSYFFEQAIADDTGLNPPPHPDTGNNTLYISVPEEGNYNVKIIPGSDGPYGYTVYAYDRDANLVLNGFEGEAITGEEKEYKFEYSPEPGETTLALEIPIDILPFIRQNLIFHKRNYLIPVAILSTPTFDATSELNESSLTFGRTGNETSLVRCIRLGFDVNRDGLKDKICLFRSKTTDFQADDTQGILKGQTGDGAYLMGSDSIIPWPKF